MLRTALIILAAGDSSRMGKPKQLLIHEGQTLLETVVQSGLSSGCNPIVVVLGAFANEIKAKHDFQALTYVINENWKTGMSSSIVAGLSALAEKSFTLDQVILSVADQPFMTNKILHQLILKQQETGKGIIACRYQHTAGVPVLFSSTYFQQLSQLHGDEGAKKLLLQYPDDVSTIDFEQGHIDIDTLSDYNNLNKNQ